MKNFIMFCLALLLVLIFAFYISLVESVLGWLIWNHVVASLWTVPSVTYWSCTGIFMIPNFIFISYKMRQLEKKL